MKAAREAWQEQMPQLDPSRLVFIDETWASTNLTRRFGRAAVGQRLVAKVPHGHWKTTTFLAALRQEALTAPLVVDGPIDGAIFLAWVQQQLVPTLRPGDLVVMDNLACHKVAGVQAAIEAVGAHVAYLPPYSPDFNPIEQVFAKLKQLLRGLAERTVAGLWSALGRLVDAFGPDECPNYFRHCGYANTGIWKTL